MDKIYIVVECGNIYKLSQVTRRVWYENMLRDLIGCYCKYGRIIKVFRIV